MKIYFACSITGGRELESVYQTYVQALQSDGHQVLTAHLAASDATAVEALLPPDKVYERDAAWLRACDALIAEVSVPSHGVGYEIGYALGIGKPALVLCGEGRKLSKMISGNPDPHLTVRLYRSPEEALQIIRRFLEKKAEDQPIGAEDDYE